MSRWDYAKQISKELRAKFKNYEKDKIAYFEKNRMSPYTKSVFEEDEL